DYSFNKAHAACYALTAYRTAWLKANYPCEYMAALISSVMNTKDRVPFYVNACHEMGISVEPPDVNASACDFAVVEGRIRFGLNVSEHPLASIRDQLRRKVDCPLSELERRRDGEIVTVGGIVGAVKQLTTKKGEPMVFLRIDDLAGSSEVVVFNSVYAASREL